MGVVTSRIHIPLLSKKSPEAYRKELEKLNQEIHELEVNKIILRRHHTTVLELIVTYAKILFVLVAIVFFFSTLPSSVTECFFFCGPLTVFCLLVYALKAAVKWYYENEINRTIDKIRKLKFKKKNLLVKMKESTRYQEAMEILEKYEPEKPVIVKEPVRWKSGTIYTRKMCHYFHNALSYVLREKQKNALICSYCQWHNGMALEKECDYVGFRCCHCFNMNPPRKKKPEDAES